MAVAVTTEGVRPVSPRRTSSIWRASSLPGTAVRTTILKSLVPAVRTSQSTWIAPTSGCMIVLWSSACSPTTPRLHSSAKHAFSSIVLRKSSASRGSSGLFFREHRRIAHKRRPTVVPPHEPPIRRECRGRRLAQAREQAFDTRWVRVAYPFCVRWLQTGEAEEVIMLRFGEAQRTGDPDRARRRDGAVPRSTRRSPGVIDRIRHAGTDDRYVGVGGHRDCPTVVIAALVVSPPMPLATSMMPRSVAARCSSSNPNAATGPCTPGTSG